MDKPLAFMTDEEALKFRERLIALGLLVPGTVQYRGNERPPMDPKLVQEYRNKLITRGILKPNPNPRPSRSQHRH